MYVHHPTSHTSHTAKKHVQKLWGERGEEEKTHSKCECALLLSFSLKVMESLRDEHPEVRKRLGSFESEVTG